MWLFQDNIFQTVKEKRGGDFVKKKKKIVFVKSIITASDV